ncbi:MAG: glycosyltransferase family 4 protein [Alphaproteobacteria bacterium]|nr:glycosyltransferase family 4 protein [Alphaproteobacteria bacterium]
MKVAVAGHFVQQGRVGGAEHMLYNLLRGMHANGAQVSLLCTELAELAPAFVDEMKRASVAILPQGRHANRFVGEQLSCLKPSLHADAVLFPNYFTPPIIPRRLGRVVTVIHDLQYLRFRELTPPARLRWLRFTHGLTFRRADSVVVLSEFVRDEVRKFYGDRAADKAVVIPNPISWARFGDSSPQDDGGRPYILSVAAHYPHKNLAVLIQALSIVRRSMDVRLVLVGQLPAALLGVKDRSRDPGQLVRELGLADHVQITGYVDDLTLGRYYRNARLFAFPSLYEGFGMPAVEAMGLGLPTVTTRCASLPEVTLGEATYVDAAQDPQAWASALLAILRDPGHRPSQSVQARIRATYDPVRIADLYLRQCRG